VKATLIALFVMLKKPLVGLLESKKFWTAVIGSTATWAAKHGVVLDPEMAPYVAAFFLALLGGQALTDNGKAAAKVHADSMNETAPLPPTVTDDDLLSGPEHGFASLGLLLSLALAAVVLISACGASQREVAIRTTYTAIVATDAGFRAWDAEHVKAIAHDPKSTTADEAIAALQAYQGERKKILDAFDVAYRLLAAAAIVEDDPKSLASALKAWDDLAAAIHTATGGKL
jgi:hypothetical protein